MSKVDLDAISDYVWQMERTGSSPCYVGTKDLRELIAELKAARKVVEAARDALDDMDPMFRTTERLADAIKELDGEK